MERFLSVFLCLALIFTSVTTLTGSVLVHAANPTVKFNFTTTPISDGTNVVLSNGSAPLYNATKGYGFVSSTAAMPSRSVVPSRIQSTNAGFVIQETNNTTSYVSANNYNYGGMVFRVDLQEAGAYALKVKTTSTNSNTWIAPSGMQASRIIGTGAWDSSGLVPNQSPAKWVDSNTWTYNYVTGRKYIEFEIEPSSRPASGSSITVGISGIEITKLDNNPASSKPTVFALGDSTEKTYTFEEAGMSGWGQIIARMFDLSKVNVINYSMGGRSMKSSHDEGRFNAILMAGKVGDYVMIHSAHNDESTDSTDRFGRGSTTTTYPKWLNEVYIPALKARGLIPVLVTAMPRTNAGKYIEDATTRPNGFNPDAPGFMRQAAFADSSVEFIELYANAKTYIDKIGAAETTYMYLSLEAGESPGKTNSGSYANGHPDNKIDGTHYKEAASKQWCKIIADQICKQATTGTTNYINVGSRVTSANMKALKSYLRTDVQNASASGDWSAIFPEFAKDVTDTGTTNAYYRNQIEKLLELGVMFKDSQGNFYPKNAMKTNEFISALCSLWKLDVNQFIKYYTSGYLTREVMAGIVYDAYLLKFGKDSTGTWIKPDYMTKYNGSTISPGDPNYDPNLTGNSAQYYPLVGWGALTDTSTISSEYAQKFYEVYNLGLIRSEKGIARGSMIDGTELEPKATVLRDKAAKELWFLWVLSQTNVKAENQVLTVPVGSTRESISYQVINYNTDPVWWKASTNVYSGDVLMNGMTPTNTQAGGVETMIYTAGSTTVNGVNFTGRVATTVDNGGFAYNTATGPYTYGSGLKFVAPTNGTWSVYVYNLGSTKTFAIYGPNAKVATDYLASTALGTTGNQVLSVPVEAGKTYYATVLGSKGAFLGASFTPYQAINYNTDPVWWKASTNVYSGDVLMNGMTPTNTQAGGVETMIYTDGSTSVNGVNFTGRVATSLDNGGFAYNTATGPYTYGSGLKFVAPANGTWSVYVFNLGSTKTFAIYGPNAKVATDYLASTALGTTGNPVLSVPVEAGKTYYATVLGSKGAFLGASFTPK